MLTVRAKHVPTFFKVQPIFLCSILEVHLTHHELPTWTVPCPDVVRVSVAGSTLTKNKLNQLTRLAGLYIAALQHVGVLSRRLKAACDSPKTCFTNCTVMLCFGRHVSIPTSQTTIDLSHLPSQDECHVLIEHACVDLLVAKYSLAAMPNTTCQRPSQADFQRDGH